VTLARVPGLRRGLAAARLLSPEQARAVFPPGIVRHDVRRGLPYRDGEVACIYSSHMIEHLARWQGLALVRECARVLEPGGLLRLATPDLSVVIDEYRAGDRSESPTAADAFMSKLATYADRPGGTLARVAHRLSTGAPHQWLYDNESLVLLLRDGGFGEPRIRGFRDSDLPDIALLEHRADSQFVEARRP
jgi:hypothetical protein